LETLIVEAMLATYPNVKDCLKEYSKCTKTNKWEKSKRDKMLLRCMVSVTCEIDPVCSTTMMWKEEKGFQVLLDHQVFNQIAKFLSEFPVRP